MAEQAVAVADEAGRAPGRLACHACGEVLGQVICDRLLLDLELAAGHERRTYQAVLNVGGGTVRCPQCGHTNGLGRVFGQVAALHGDVARAEGPGHGNRASARGTSGQAAA